MGHYDWRYESFSIEEVKKEIENINKRISDFTEKRTALVYDLDRVIYSFTIHVLEQEKERTERYLETLNTKLSRWHEVSERIMNGEDMTWEHVWNTIDR